MNALVMIGFALLVVAALVAFRFSGQPLWRAQARRLACPASGETVDTVLVQDIRTGQWKAVRSCSAYRGGEPHCDLDCARLMNLGLPLARARA
jgi:hypothetical protein